LPRGPTGPIAIFAVTTAPLPKNSAQDAPLYGAVLCISLAALAPLVYVLMIRDGNAEASKSLSFMPAVNASLNGVAAACQVGGYLAIRARKRDLHRLLMLAAFGASALFFVGYLVYHYVHGDTTYPGTGGIRIAYLTVLASHVILSIVLVPLLLVALYRALRGTFDRHKPIAKVTLPIWLYVSVTGIVVFWMLKAATAQ
jgi:putative membrane protein